MASIDPNQIVNLNRGKTFDELLEEVVERGCGCDAANGYECPIHSVVAQIKARHDVLVAKTKRSPFDPLIESAPVTMSALAQEIRDFRALGPFDIQIPPTAILNFVEALEDWIHGGSLPEVDRALEDAGPGIDCAKHDDDNPAENFCPGELFGQRAFVAGILRAVLDAQILKRPIDLPVEAKA